MAIVLRGFARSQRRAAVANGGRSIAAVSIFPNPASRLSAHRKLGQAVRSGHGEGATLRPAPADDGSEDSGNPNSVCPAAMASIISFVLL